MALVGGGFRSADTVVRELIAGASREIQIAAYTITVGAEDILDLIEEKMDEGVKVNIVVNRFEELESRVRNRLNKLARTHPELWLSDFRPRAGEGDMHAKAMVFDREVAVVGSMNLSHRGLVAGHEISVGIQGSGASLVAKAIDKLMQDSRSRRL